MIGESSYDAMMMPTISTTMDGNLDPFDYLDEARNTSNTVDGRPNPFDYLEEVQTMLETPGAAAVFPGVRDGGRRGDRHQRPPLEAIPGGVAQGTNHSNAFLTVDGDGFLDLMVATSEEQERVRALTAPVVVSPPAQKIGVAAGAGVGLQLDTKATEKPTILNQEWSVSAAPRPPPSARAKPTHFNQIGSVLARSNSIQPEPERVKDVVAIMIQA